MTIEKLHQLFLARPQACTDTRNILDNCIFFALKGENFNGNSFAVKAIEMGAAFAVVDESKYATSSKIILVDEVLTTLQELATYHRNYCNAKVIGLTGSNGKTTTKELIYAVLSSTYRTVATKGNLNNHIGVPLSLLQIRENTEIAIIEMGANHLEEIEFLCGLAQPDYGYITNFGKAHLEGFGNEAGVVKGKSELYTYLIQASKPIFYNADDHLQQEILTSYSQTFGFGTAGHHYCPIKFLGAHPFVSLMAAGVTINTQLIGRYNFTNCSAAVMIGKYFKVGPDKMKLAIEKYIPENNRSQLIEKKGNRIVLDAYNANPTSMRAALESFKEMKGANKKVFLGDMFELGETASEEHQKIANLVEEMGFNEACLIGVHFNKTNTCLQQFESFDTLVTYLKKHPSTGSTILIKGSRGMALERVLDFI